MSDNPFADLLGAFKRGWEAAGRAENLSTQHVRSRPSFWNPFLTWRDEEERELCELYAAVNAAFEASPFMDPELLDETVTQIVSTACETAECLPPHDTLAAMTDAVSQLIGEEFFSFYSFEEENWHKDFGVEDAMELKRALKRKQQFLSDTDRLFEIGCWKIALIFGSLLHLLPESFQNDDGGGENSACLTFGVGLVDIIDRPAAAIEGTLSTMFDKDIYDGDLFADVRAQLEHNYYAASGLDPANKSVSTKQLIPPTQSKGKTPAELAGLYLKDTPFADFFSFSLPLQIPESARFEHCHILGGTGHGKTQCLQYLLHADLLRAVQEPISIVVIDSQGDLIRKVSSSTLFDPGNDASLAKRFIFIDPADIDTPPALNLFDPGLERLADYTPHQRELAFNSLVDIYGRFFGALLGADLTARQNTVFRYLARLMLTVKGATIHTLITLMDDIAPFKDHIKKLDPTARRFFEKEFSRKGFNATRQQIKDRLYAVLSIPTFDRLFSAPKSKVSFFDALNSGKIVLVSTAKDLLKSDGTAIFGRFILALIEHAVMERANLAEEKRTPVFLYMDEAQDYFDDTVETLLVEARKYNCGLTLAHQNLAQLSPRLKAIFMGNTTIKLAGGVTDADARAIAPDMRTTSDFLLSMKKRKGVSDFALSVRNLTPNAVKVSIPLGFLEDMPLLEPHKRDTLLERNRKRIGYTPEMEEPQEAPSPAPVPTPSAAAPETPPAPTSETTSAPQRGHRSLQNRIKQAAQKCGFSATIEQQVLDGKGRVDVALERDDIRIACEVSVTTKIDHERHNIEKCLAAGYTYVWVTSPDSAQLEKLREGLLPSLPTEIRERVSFLSEDELIAQLDALTTQTSTSQSRVLGYDVHVVHTQINPLQSKDRRKRLAAVLSSARQQKSKGA